MKMDRVLSSGRKQRCLFNTMHVKTSMGLLTAVYLFALALFDHHLYWQEMTDTEAIVTAATSIVILVAIVMAQFGLNFEKYFLLFPLLIVQALFLLLIYTMYSKAVAEQIFYAQMHPRVIVRLILIMMYELVMTAMHTYALLITIRCILYFRAKKQRNLDRLSFPNRSFMDRLPRMKNLKDRIVNLKIDATTDDETVIGDGANGTTAIDATSIGSGPLGSARFSLPTAFAFY